MPSATGPQPASIEFRLLCLVARPAGDLTSIRELLLSPIDFQVLLRQAAEHGVRPSLIRRLGDLAWEGVPAEARTTLETFRRQHLAYSLTVAAEIDRIADAFDRAGIPFATLKGAALATAVYGDLAAREYNDIDIVVPVDRAGSAERLLSDFGYRGFRGDAAFRKAFLAYQGQYTLQRPGLDAAVDLHWQLGGAYLPFPLASEEIWSERVDLRLGRRDVPTLGGAELALLLAGHGTKEQWACLKWLADFAWLADRQRDLDWAAIHRRARQRRCGNAVLLAFALAHDLLGTPVPPVIDEALQSTGPVRTLATSLAREMKTGTISDRENLSDIHLCDHLVDKARALVWLAATPTTGDFEAMPLPQAMWPAYRFSRPFRLMAKAAASVVRLAL